MGYVLAAYALVVSSLLFYGLHLGAERARLLGRSGRVHAIVAFALVGLLLGGLVGILLRPSVPDVGPVPLDTIFARGDSTGVARAAEGRTALHWIAVASAIGAAAGGVGAHLLSWRTPQRPAA